MDLILTLCAKAGLYRLISDLSYVNLTISHIQPLIS